MAYKRENGMGSVFKRKNRKHRPWIALGPTRYDIGDDGRVAIKQPMIGAFRTQREALDALEEFRRHPSARYNITLERLYEEWEQKAEKKLSKSMLTGYQAAWKKLAPLHGMRVRELRRQDMQRIIDLYAEPHLSIRDGKTMEPGQSESSLKNIKILMTQLLNEAVIDDVVAKNYAKYLEVPKGAGKAREPFTPEEINAIRRAIPEVPYADVIYFLIYTGYRISECLQFTKDAYDPVECTLTGGLKTAAGKNRCVPIPDKVLPILEAWLARGGETIFCRPNGRAWDKDSFREQCWYPALEKIGTRRLTPHCARHTFATQAQATGLRPEDIAAILGHESYDTTAKIYVHQDISTLRDAINSI